jgi:hypothetical protein
MFFLVIAIHLFNKYNQDQFPHGRFLTTNYETILYYLKEKMRVLEILSFAILILDFIFGFKWYHKALNILCTLAAYFILHSINITI